MLKTDIVLMVGLPASGKSTLVSKYDELGYVILSLDKKSMSNATDTQAIDTAIWISEKKSLDKKLKFVIDNTNITNEIRNVFIEYARKNNLTIGIHWMNTSKDDCLINSLHRMYKNYGEVFLHSSDISAVAKSALNNFVISAIFAMNKRYNKPKKTEVDEFEKTAFVRVDDWGYSNKAVFIDLDGTIRDSTGEQPYPLKNEDINILSNSESVLLDYKKKGYLIIGVTNQSAVSKGILTKLEVVDLIEETNNQLGSVMDDYHYCPHLPPRDICYCRKPQSGMGVLLQHKHKLDLSKCIMVGDRTSDKTFATRLGIKFFYPDLFFNR